MTAVWQALGQGACPAWLANYPKIARLFDLHRQGHAVPDGWIARFEAGVSQLPPLGPGPWILRSVLPNEDDTHAQLTGMCLSLMNLRSKDALTKAQARCARHVEQLHAQGLLPHPPQALAWLLQAQVQAQCLALAIHDPRNDRWYIEIYPPSEDPFGGAHRPWARGALSEIQDKRYAPQGLRALLDPLRVAMPEPAGLEVEAVLDAQGQWHCVQAKPNAVALFSQYDTFLDAAQTQLERSGQSWRDWPQLVLDAEHNPEPLSAAHTWLMEILAQGQEPPSYLVLCGWLYSVPSPPNNPAAQGSVQDALAQLGNALIPKAQASLASWQTKWTGLVRPQIGAALDDAIAHCRRFLDARNALVSPLLRTRPTTAREDFSFATTLSQRDAFAQNLPTRWDIAAPSLAMARLPPPSASPHAQPTTGLAAPVLWDLLEEIDDHLFALALHAPSQLWRTVAASEAIAPELLFGACGDALRKYGQKKMDRDTLLARAHKGLEARTRQATLVPAPRLTHGAPCPPAQTTHGRGLPFGPSVSGKIYKRCDLEHLLSAPPKDPGAILAIPALTAPAALALHRLKIRAVVCEFGGVGSHGARMAAELGLSALVGCTGCMQLREGQAVALDTVRGRIYAAPHRDDP